MLQVKKKRFSTEGDTLLTLIRPEAFDLSYTPVAHQSKSLFFHTVNELTVTSILLDSATTEITSTSTGGYIKRFVDAKLY